MIDGVGRGQPPLIAVARSLPARLEGAQPLVQPAVNSTLARISKDLAASPPVDSARVAALRNAIASGSYRIDPDKIAARMMALETPGKP